jgi:hypothetical protein
MKRPLLAAHALILLLLMVPNAFATITPADGARYHIRTTDPMLTALVQDGVRTSPTFRALVERLIASDVVVYLRCDHQMAMHADGRLTFAANAGGLRYVVVRLRRVRWRASTSEWVTSVSWARPAVSRSIPRPPCTPARRCCAN